MLSFRTQTAVVVGQCSKVCAVCVSMPVYAKHMLGSASLCGLSVQHELHCIFPVVICISASRCLAPVWRRCAPRLHECAALPRR
jgi:hypothetical protein